MTRHPRITSSDVYTELELIAFHAYRSAYNYNEAWRAVHDNLDWWQVAIWYQNQAAIHSRVAMRHRFDYVDALRNRH